MRKPLTDEQKKARDRAQARYDANNTTQIHLKLNNVTDSDILDRLATVGNKQAYIKDLIRADIEKSTS